MTGMEAGPAYALAFTVAPAGPDDVVADWYEKDIDRLYLSADLRVISLGMAMLLGLL